MYMTFIMKLEKRIEQLERRCEQLERRCEKLEKHSHKPVTFISDENGFLKVKE